MEKNAILTKDINFILSSLGVSLTSNGENCGFGPHTIRVVSVYNEDVWRSKPRHCFNIEVTVTKDSFCAPSKKPNHNSWSYSKSRVIHFNRRAKDAAQYSFENMLRKDDAKDMLACLGINIGYDCINKVTFKEK
jgi:hypothetical protein